MPVDLHSGFTAVFSWVIRLLVLISVLQAQTVLAASQDLDQHWQYRWGDSPFHGEHPLWVDGTEPEQWQSIGFPSNPPERNGQTNIWYRTQLPENSWRDPVLYIFSIDLIAQVYLDGKLIYQYGQFDSQGQGRFAGWPWHMITLPADAAGKMVYFRVFSNYMDIGLWGEVKVMERMALYQQVWDRSLEGLIITVFCLFIGLISLVLATYRAQRQAFAALALFNFSAAGLSLSATQAKQFLLEHALFWDYVEAGSYYTLPLALVLLLGRGFQLLPRRISLTLELVFAGYLLLAISLSLMGIVSLANTYPPFDFLFALLIPAALLIAFIRTRLNVDQKVILLATTVMTLLLIMDLAVAHSWIDWKTVPVGWGSLVFSLALVVLAVRHYLNTQKNLAELNQTLENRVKQRTQELKALAEHEARRAEALSYTQKRSEQFNTAIGYLEQQTSPEEAFSELVKLLPELYNTLPCALYLPQDNRSQFSLHRCWLLPEGQDLPTEIDENHSLPEGWKSFALRQAHPQKGDQVLALLWLDLASLQTQVIDLEPLAIETLMVRAVERINLTLSKVCLQSILRDMSYKDSLTGLKNRRYLDEFMPQLCSMAEKADESLVLLLCDIDHFKRFNDTYGHAAGDEVLREVSQQMQQVFRKSDLICRFGGEEFVVVMPAATIAEAIQQVERLAERLREQKLYFAGEELAMVTLSVGLCHLMPTITTPEQLMACADQALYQSKHNGRNQIKVYRAEQIKD